MFNVTMVLYLDSYFVQSFDVAFDIVPEVGKTDKLFNRCDSPKEIATKFQAFDGTCLCGRLSVP